MSTVDAADHSREITYACKFPDNPLLFCERLWHFDESRRVPGNRASDPATNATHSRLTQPMDVSPIILNLLKEKKLVEEMNMHVGT